MRKTYRGTSPKRILIIAYLGVIASKRAHEEAIGRHQQTTGHCAHQGISRVHYVDRVREKGLHASQRLLRQVAPKLVHRRVHLRLHGQLLYDSLHDLLDLIHGDCANFARLRLEQIRKKTQMSQYAPRCICEVRVGMRVLCMCVWLCAKSHLACALGVILRCGCVGLLGSRIFLFSRAVRLLFTVHLHSLRYTFANGSRTLPHHSKRYARIHTRHTPCARTRLTHTQVAPRRKTDEAKRMQRDPTTACIVFRMILLFNCAWIMAITKVRRIFER